MTGMRATNETSEKGPVGSRLPLILPWVVVAIAAALAWGYLYFVNRTAFRYAIPETLNSCLEKNKAGGVVTWKEIQTCEANTAVSFEDVVKAPVEELKWILEVIGTLAGFFVVVQGAAAYFSAEAYKDRAEKAVSDMNETAGEIRAMRKGLRRRYPLFGDLEKARSKAFEDLASKVSEYSRSPGSQPTEALRWNAKWKLYSSMNVADRQRILSLESFASIDLHPGGLSESEWSENLRRYAFFYQSKFEYEKTVGVASFGDLERAEGYLRLAVKTAPKDFTLMNDVGVVCLDILKLAEKTAVLERSGHKDLVEMLLRYKEVAVDYFQQSLAIESRQQRAHYNLAVAHAVYTEPRNYLAGRTELEEALQQSNWQKLPPVPQFKALVRYNLGCYRARVLVQCNRARAPFTVNTPGVRECLDVLEQAMTLGSEGIEAIEEKTVEEDCDWKEGTVPERTETDEIKRAKKGDFVELYELADAGLRSELRRIREGLLKAATSAQQASPPQSKAQIRVARRRGTWFRPF
jgi:tetratricopeptide (TPR) repeat protein